MLSGVGMTNLYCTSSLAVRTSFVMVDVLTGVSASHFYSRERPLAQESESLMKNKAMRARDASWLLLIAGKFFLNFLEAIMLC